MLEELKLWLRGSGTPPGARTPASPAPATPPRASQGELLVEAAACGNQARVANLLAAVSPAARARHVAKWGGKALQEAAFYGHAGMVSELVVAGADVNTRSKEAPDTPLQHAASNGHEQVLAMLLQAGARVHRGNKWGDTALHDAAANGHLVAVSVLLEAGADANSHNRWGSHALHKAALMGHTGAVACLLDAGADVNAVDRDGETPLQHATLLGHLDVVELLLAAGAAVNAQNSWGNTALHTAASSGRAEVAMLLIHAGADESARNNAGRTPSQVASDSSEAAIGRAVAAIAWSMLQVGRQQQPLQLQQHHRLPQQEEQQPALPQPLRLQQQELVEEQALLEEAALEEAAQHQHQPQWQQQQEEEEWSQAPLEWPLQPPPVPLHQQMQPSLPQHEQHDAARDEQRDKARDEQHDEEHPHAALRASSHWSPLPQAFLHTPRRPPSPLAALPELLVAPSPSFLQLRTSRSASLPQLLLSPSPMPDHVIPTRPSLPQLLIPPSPSSSDLSVAAPAPKQEPLASHSSSPAQLAVHSLILPPQGQQHKQRLPVRQPASQGRPAEQLPGAHQLQPAQRTRTLPRVHTQQRQRQLQQQQSPAMSLFRDGDGVKLPPGFLTQVNMLDSRLVAAGRQVVGQVVQGVLTCNPAALLAGCVVLLQAAAEDRQALQHCDVRMTRVLARCQAVFPALQQLQQLLTPPISVALDVAFVESLSKTLLILAQVLLGLETLLNELRRRSGNRLAQMVLLLRAQGYRHELDSLEQELRDCLAQLDTILSIDALKHRATVTLLGWEVSKVAPWLELGEHDQRPDLVQLEGQAASAAGGMGGQPVEAEGRRRRAADRGAGRGPAQQIPSYGLH